MDRNEAGPPGPDAPLPEGVRTAASGEVLREARAERAARNALGRRLIGSVMAGLVLMGLQGAAPAQQRPPTRTSVRSGAFTSLPADPTLRELIHQSLAARPELERERAVIRALRAQVPQAGALPDPMLQIGIQNDGFTSIEIGNMEGSYVSLMASQSFPWPGTLGLRERVVELGAVQAKQVAERIRLSTEAEVRRAYLDLVLTRDRLELLTTLHAVWEQSFGAARARYESGSGAQSDVLRAQLELDRLAQRRVGLENQERTDVQALNRLRTRPLNERIETSRHVRDLAVLASLQDRFDEADAIARSPELAAARVAVSRAGRSIELAQRGYYPEFLVSTGIMYRGSMPPMWQVTLGGTLPVYAASRQGPAVAENQAWKVAAQRDVEAIEQVLKLLTAARRTAFSSLLRNLDLYRGLLVRSEATRESTLTQYMVGRAPFASVLEANAGLISDRESYLETMAAAHRILIADAEVSLSPPETIGGAASASMGTQGSAGGSAVSPAPGGGSQSAADSNAGSGGGMPTM